MKELCCKILAAVFILLIIASLANMRQDFMSHRHTLSDPQTFLLANQLNAFDTVLVGPQKHIGVVEEVTNNLYHVVFQDEFHHSVHGVFTKDQLQKVLIVVPHKHD